LVLTAGAVAVATFATNWIAALYTFLGAFVYAVVYTVWLKRRTWLNIVIGGLAGSFAVLAGAAAVVPSLSAEALVLAVVLFLWTPPHFWSLSIAFRDDYAAAGVPMLPVVKGDAAAARAILVNAALLVAASLALGMFAPGWIYLGFALLGGGYFLRECVRLVVQPGRRQAMRAFHASLMQLSLVLIGVMLDAAFR
jgi:protoheme IX farnesyltransferase